MAGIIVSIQANGALEGHALSWPNKYIEGTRGSASLQQ